MTVINQDQINYNTAPELKPEEGPNQTISRRSVYKKFSSTVVDQPETEIGSKNRKEFQRNLAPLSHPNSPLCLNMEEEGLSPVTAFDSEDE